MNKAQQAELETELKHAKDLLKEAASEIRRLKHNNGMQSVRLDMFDKCMQLVNISPPSQNSMLMSPDVEYAINKFLQP